MMISNYKGKDFIKSVLLGSLIGVTIFTLLTYNLKGRLDFQFVILCLGYAALIISLILTGYYIYLYKKFKRSNYWILSVAVCFLLLYILNKVFSTRTFLFLGVVICFFIVVMLYKMITTEV